MADDPEYAFRHALVRDVAYAQLPRSARAEKHRLAAEWIARSASRPDLVAHHYSEALSLVRAARGDTGPLEEPARNALRAAGDRARSLGAFNEAMELYRRALDLRPAGRERRELLLDVVAVSAGTLDPDAAPLVEAAARECEAAGDFSGAADAETSLSLYALYGGDRELGLRHGARSVELAERSGSADSLAQALAARGRFVMLAGDDEAAIPLSLRALELAEQAGLEQTAVHALITVGTARARLGSAEGLALLEQAVDRAQAINDPSVVFRALNNQADLIRATEGLAASVPVWRRIEELVDRFGMYVTRRWFDSLSAWDHYQGGQWDESLRYADAFFRTAGGAHYLDGQVRLVRAWIALSRADERSGAHELELAAERLRGATDPQVCGPSLVYQASLQLLLGRPDAAAPLVDELAAFGSRTIVYAADCTTHLAWLALDTGRTLDVEPRRSVWVDANTAILEGRLGDAIDVLDATGVRTEAAYARLRRARIEPGPWLDEAEAFYREVRAARFLDEIDELRAGAMPRSA
jgi:tetratricopeptide (TPR) repeat protein